MKSIDAILQHRDSNARPLNPEPQTLNPNIQTPEPRTGIVFHSSTDQHTRIRGTVLVAAVVVVVVIIAVRGARQTASCQTATVRGRPRAKKPLGFGKDRGFGLHLRFKTWDFPFGSRVSGMDFQLCSTGLFFRSSGMYAEFSLGFRLEALDHNACATSVAIARFRICL